MTWFQHILCFLILIILVRGQKLSSPSNATHFEQDSEICNFFMSPEHARNVNRTIHDLLAKPTSLIELNIGVEGVSLRDIDLFDLQKNGLFNWIWTLRRDGTLLLSYPVDLHVITLGFLRFYAKDATFNLNVTKWPCRIDYKQHTEMILDLLINDIFGNKTNGFICHRYFEHQGWKSLMYYITNVWIGYDYKCFLLEDKSLEKIVKKTHITVVIAIMSCVLALMHPLLYYFIERTSKIKAEKLHRYDRDDSPYGFHRSMMWFFFRSYSGKETITNLDIELQSDKTCDPIYTRIKNWRRALPEIRMLLVFISILLLIHIIDGYIELKLHDCNCDNASHTLYPSIYRFGLPEIQGRLNNFIFAFVGLLLVFAFDFVAIVTEIEEKDFVLLISLGRFLTNFESPFVFIPVNQFLHVGHKKGFAHIFIIRCMLLLCGRFWGTIVMKSFTFYKSRFCFLSFLMSALLMFINIPCFLVNIVFSLLTCALPGIWLILFLPIVEIKKSTTQGAVRYLRSILFAVILLMLSWFQRIKLGILAFMLRTFIYTLFVAVPTAQETTIRYLIIFLTAFIYIAKFGTGFACGYKKLLDLIYEAKDKLYEIQKDTKHLPKENGYLQNKPMENVIIDINGETALQVELSLANVDSKLKNKNVENIPAIEISEVSEETEQMEILENTEKEDETVSSEVEGNTRDDSKKVKHATFAINPVFIKDEDDLSSISSFEERISALELKESDKKYIQEEIFVTVKEFQYVVENCYPYKEQLVILVLKISLTVLFLFITITVLEGHESLATVSYIRFTEIMSVMFIVLSPSVADAVFSDPDDIKVMNYKTEIEECVRKLMTGEVKAGGKPKNLKYVTFICPPLRRRYRKKWEVKSETASKCNNCKKCCSLAMKGFMELICCCCDVNHNGYCTCIRYIEEDIEDKTTCYSCTGKTVNKVEVRIRKSLANIYERRESAHNTNNIELKPE